MKVRHLTELLSQLDPEANLWFLDTWPYPNEGKMINAVVQDDNGDINLLHMSMLDMRDFVESNFPVDCKDNLLYLNLISR